MQINPTLFQTTLDFLIWREQIEAKFSVFSAEILIDAWESGCVDDENFYYYYVELPI